MIGAVSGLRPGESPSRQQLTILNLTRFAEVNHQSSRQVVLMAGTYGCQTVGDISPPRPSGTGLVGAAGAGDIHDAVRSMLLAVQRLLGVGNINERAFTARCM